MNNVTKKGLLKVIEAMQGIPVLVAGDFMLDKYVWGRVDRISPEAPVPVFSVDHEDIHRFRSRYLLVSREKRRFSPTAPGRPRKSGRTR